jgi:prophage regulatory protein
MMVQKDTSVTARPKRLLRLPVVEERVGLGKSSIYDLVKRGDFPAPLKLSRRCVAWPEEAIDGWIEKRIQAGNP